MRLSIEPIVFITNYIYTQKSEAGFSSTRGAGFSNTVGRLLNNGGAVCLKLRICFRSSALVYQTLGVRLLNKRGVGWLMSRCLFTGFVDEGSVYWISKGSVFPNKRGLGFKKTRVVFFTGCRRRLFQNHRKDGSWGEEGKDGPMEKWGSQ